MLGVFTIAFFLSREAIVLSRILYSAAAMLFLSLTNVSAAAPDGTQLPPQPKVRPAGIPANFMMVSPCIPGMGEHWANPKLGLHATTIYGTYEGKPVFTEIMLLPQDFASGKSFTDVLIPLAGYHIDHVDIEYLAHGHPGMPYAHYDIHGYYVSHAAHEKFCPPTGKAPM
jgi:hypothetical protein